MSVDDYLAEATALAGLAGIMAASHSRLLFNFLWRQTEESGNYRDCSFFHRVRDVPVFAYCSIALFIHCR